MVLRFCSHLSYLPTNRTAAAGEPEELGAIRSGIKTARLALQEVAGPLRAFEEGAKNFYETGRAHSACEFVRGSNFIWDI